MCGNSLGFVVVTYNQTGGLPELDYSDLHWDKQGAIDERDHKAGETARAGRGERHVIAEVFGLEDDGD